MTEAEYKQILGRYLPPQTIDSIYDFMQKHCVQFHITRERHSKLGDYRWPQNRHLNHAISVNGNLNPYLFLLVLLHEMGHLNTFVRHGADVQPHGHEWQQEYRQLLAAYANHFPADAVPLLQPYIQHIPLNRALGRQLEAQLHHYDKDYTPSANPTLNQLEPGTCFRLAQKPGLRLRALERRRTRWLCEELGTRRQFLVQGTAEVELI